MGTASTAPMSTGCVHLHKKAAMITKQWIQKISPLSRPKMLSVFVFYRKVDIKTGGKRDTANFAVSTFPPVFVSTALILPTSLRTNRCIYVVCLYR